MHSYKVTVRSDMGHLMISSDNGHVLPMYVSQFVHNLIPTKVDRYTDKEGHGCSFFVLKPGLQPRWTYYLNTTDTSGVSVEMNYLMLDTYQEECMTPFPFSRRGLAA